MPATAGSPLNRCRMPATTARAGDIPYSPAQLAQSSTMLATLAHACEFDFENPGEGSTTRRGSVFTSSGCPLLRVLLDVWNLRYSLPGGATPASRVTNWGRLLATNTR